MRILLIQPNYHAGGAEIAGNWPQGWVAYVGGALKHAGMNDLRFVDAMTSDILDETLRDIIRRAQPDVVLATAITPIIYKAQTTLRIVRDTAPAAVTVLGGIHPTFMYAQVLGEAPWIDYVVRGEGEEIAVELLRAIAAGSVSQDRPATRGIAYLEDGKVVATPPVRSSRTSTPSRRTGACSSGINTFTFRSTAAWRFRISRAAARSRAASARSGSFGAPTARATPSGSSTSSRRSCATTRSGFSFWPTKSRPSTVRSSSLCAKSW